MERAPGRTSSNRKPALGWRVAGQYLPMAAFALAAFFFIRMLVGGDGAPAAPPLAQVDAEHSSRLAANIAFFEAHAAETKDNLSYNRLTGLYLQRLRETGDAADVTRAEASALKSLENAPNDQAGLVNLALVRLAQHDFEAAGDLARQAIAVRPSRTDGNAVLGDVQMALGQYDEAGANYALFLDKEPGSSAFSREATLAEVQGNVPLAEQFWQAAIDADRYDAPDSSAWARVQLATLYFNNGRLDDARTRLQTALKIWPGYPNAAYVLARVDAADGDLDGAIEELAPAVNRLPQPDFVALLGDLYAADGQPAKAAQRYSLVGAIQQLFEANGIRNDLNLILFALDHGQAGQDTLDRAAKAYAERPSLAAADVYAWALYRAGRLDEAAAKADEALRTGTRDPMYEFHAGMIAAARGDTAGARLHLGNATKLNAAFSLLHTKELRDTLKQLGEAPK